MWIFLNNAFFSIVAISPRANDLPPAVARERASFLLVRARIEGDIERVFPNAEVRRTDTRDYRYRAFVPREAVAQRMAATVDAIDYHNFKGSIALDDEGRHNAYLSVWQVLYNAQRRERL